MRQLLAVLVLLAATTANAGTFHATPFARDLGEARNVVILDDGTVLVSRPSMFDVIALRDRDGDGRADDIRTAVSSIEGAHGLAMHHGTLYVAGVRQIVAVDREPDGSFGAPREIVGDLPNGGGHPRRTLAVGKEGEIYLSLAENGTLLQIAADGTTRRIHARGLRNVSGLAWNPKSGELFGTDGGELNRIGDGLDYESVAPAAENAPASIVFDDDGAVYGVTSGDVVRLHDGKLETLASIEGAKLAGFARSATAMFASDERGIVYRIGSAPEAMTSSGSDEPSRTILGRVFSIGDLRNAEAIVHDEEQDVYFVSGTGFIARVSPDGKVLDKSFADGVKAPKGMAIQGVELWVADGTTLRVFDRVTGSERRTIDMAKHGAVFLNHVAVGTDGAVYVTDTDVRIKGNRERVRAGNGRIFRIEEDGDVEVAIEGEELRSPAGIAWDGMRFLVAQAYGNEIVAWQPGHHARAVLRGPGAYDGLTVLPNGVVVVTSQNDNAVHIGTKGDLKPLFARTSSPAGIAFDRKRNRLLLPSSDSVEAWTLPPMSSSPAPETREGLGKSSGERVRNARATVPLGEESPGKWSTTR